MGIISRLTHPGVLLSGVLELAPGVAPSNGAGINLFPGHDGKPRS